MKPERIIVTAAIAGLALLILACSIFVIIATFAPGVGAQQRPPPPFTATWQRPHVARLSWSQPPDVRETCVVRNTTLIGCWYDLPTGPTGLSLGDAGPSDGNYRPQAGDVFVLAMDGVSARAELRGVVYVGMVMR